MAKAPRTLPTYAYVLIEGAIVLALVAMMAMLMRGLL